VSGAANARCNLGQTRATPQCTPTLSKQPAWNYITETHGVWTQVYGNMYCIWRPLLANIRIYHIFSEATITGLHFAAENIGLSSLTFFWWAHKFCLFLQEGRFGRSRSSKVIDVGTNRKCVCDFLLVRNSNLGPILHHFGDFAAFMCSWPYPYSTLILGVFPLHQIAVWWFGVVVTGNVVGQINEVTLRQARLVLGWVTVYGRVNHLGM